MQETNSKMAKKFIAAAASLLALSGFVSPSLAEDGSPTKSYRVGLALGGGGARGAAEIGVLRVLEKEGIKIDCISGTSMGAIIGGLYASGLTLDQIEARFRDGSLLRSYYTVPVWFRFAVIPIFLPAHILRVNTIAGFYRGTKFANYIREAAPPDHKLIETFKTPFWAITCNLLDGDIVAVKSGDLGTALEASAAIPVIRRPVKMDGKLLVDGGLLCNVPVEYARNMGAEYVIAVDVDEALKAPRKNQFHKFKNISDRTLDMVLNKFDNDQCKTADIVIHPNVDGIPLLDSKIVNVERAIRAGEEAARAALPRIRALLEKQKQAVVVR